MGRSIVYCDACGVLLKEEDFDKGRASVQGNRSFCADCKTAEPAAEEAPAPTPPPRKRASRNSTGRIPVSGSSETGHRLRAVRESAMGPSKPRGNAALLYAAIGGGVLLLLAILVAVLTGQKTKPSGRSARPAAYASFGPQIASNSTGVKGAARTSSAFSSTWAGSFMPASGATTPGTERAN
jgi:hypothetical protein